MTSARSLPGGNARGGGVGMCGSPQSGVGVHGSRHDSTWCPNGREKAAPRLLARGQPGREAGPATWCPRGAVLGSWAQGWREEGGQPEAVTAGSCGLRGAVSLVALPLSQLMTLRGKRCFGAASARAMNTWVTHIFRSFRLVFWVFWSPRPHT